MGQVSVRLLCNIPDFMISRRKKKLHLRVCVNGDWSYNYIFVVISDYSLSKLKCDFLLVCRENMNWNNDQLVYIGTLPAGLLSRKVTK